MSDSACPRNPRWLADEIDRLDALLDGLADGLLDFVRDCVRTAVAEALDPEAEATNPVARADRTVHRAILKRRESWNCKPIVGPQSRDSAIQRSTEEVDMRVGELCRRLGVPVRQLRYVLEEGHLPPGLDAAPGRGEHRDLDPAQTFWLAIVLALKQNGVKTPVAAGLADRLSSRSTGLRLATRGGFNWDPGFDPFAGHLEAECGWWIDVGDQTYCRLLTDGNPSRRGTIEDFGWGRLDDPRRLAVKGEVRPLVVIRLELSQLARRLMP